MTGGTGNHRGRVGIHLCRPQQPAGVAVDGEYLGAGRVGAEDPAVAEDQLVAVDGRAGAGQVARHPGIAGDILRPQHPPAASCDRPQLATVVRDVNRAVVHGRGGRDRAGCGQRPPRRQPAHAGRGDLMLSGLEVRVIDVLPGHRPLPWRSPRPGQGHGPGRPAASSPATAAITVATRPRPAFSILRLVMPIPTPCQVSLPFALRYARFHGKARRERFSGLQPLAASRSGR
jgi:hypothetical protein